MAALSHDVGSKVTITQGWHKDQTGTVKVMNGHKVVMIDSTTIIYGMSDTMVKRA